MRKGPASEGAPQWSQRRAVSAALQRAQMAGSLNEAGWGAGSGSSGRAASASTLGKGAGFGVGEGIGAAAALRGVASRTGTVITLGFTRAHASSWRDDSRAAK